MKFLRKLAHRGESDHVAIPPQVIDFLRWRRGDMLVLEVLDRNQLIVRLPSTADDFRAPAASANLSLAVPPTV